MSKEIVDEMIKLFPSNRIQSMLGASNLTRDDNHNSFAFRFKMCPKTNYFKMIYDEGQDLYNMEFYLIRNTKVAKVREFKGVSVEEVHMIFEKTTGLRLRL